MSGRFGWLTHADWFGPARARVWRNFFFLPWAIALVWCVLSRNGLDPLGKPLGTDFQSFYAASKLVAEGHPAAAYSVQLHHATEAAVFGRDTGYAAFFYPPLFLLICAPLACLSYFQALVVWLGVTGAAFVATARAWLSERFGVLTVLAFPAVLTNLEHGQNGFLSAALIGAGAHWMDRRPIVAGIMFGLLAYKPHLGLLLPVVLILSRRWATFASAAVTVLAFAGLSIWLFGADTWAGFLADSHLAREVLEHGGVEPNKMVSAFAAVRVLGGPVSLAYVAQAAVVAYVVWSLVRTRRMWSRSAAEPALLALAALLGSPFLLDYDLVIMALPLAWLASMGASEGFRPWEKATLMVAFALPLFARSLAGFAHLPLAPVVLLMLFDLTLRRVTAPASAVAHQAVAYA